MRLKFLKELQKIAMEKHIQIAQHEILTTVYNSTVAGDIDFSSENELTVEQIAKQFEQKLSERKLEELSEHRRLWGRIGMMFRFL